MKHAFLIIAHNEFEQLAELINLLDNRHNFIYVHIDKKVNGYSKENLTASIRYSRVEVFQEISVQWGDSSQMECEMFLLKMASKEYHDYYHFLSGVDLPIKGMDQIHQFFERNNGKEFIHFDSCPAPRQAIERVLYRHYFSKYLKRYSSKVITKSLFMLDHFTIWVQRMLGLKRTLPYLKIQKGCNWCSITNGLVETILEDEYLIRKMLKHSLCGDEVFIQTVCVNSEYKNRLYNNDYDNNYESCLRLIVWDETNNKTPRTFSDEDIQLLRNSDCLFARKFSMSRNPEFTKKWIDEIKEKNKNNE